MCEKTFYKLLDQYHVEHRNPYQDNWGSLFSFLESDKSMLQENSALQNIKQIYNKISINSNKHRRVTSCINARNMPPPYSCKVALCHPKSKVASFRTRPSTSCYCHIAADQSNKYLYILIIRIQPELHLRKAMIQIDSSNKMVKAVQNKIANINLSLKKQLISNTSSNTALIKTEVDENINRAFNRGKSPQRKCSDYEINRWAIRYKRRKSQYAIRTPYH